MKKLFVLVGDGRRRARASTAVAQRRLHGHGRSQLDAEARPPAGKPWVVTIRVLQHGVTPMPDAKPEVRIRNAAGKLFVFKAKKTAVVGSYRARVVFPKAGRYSLAVYDGFPSPTARGCTRSSPVLIVAV